LDEDEVPACQELSFRFPALFPWQKSSRLQVNEGSEAAQSDRLRVEKSLMGRLPPKVSKSDTLQLKKLEED